jgi:demethylmenaquinone methyltransferase/2-methoxy-6-polyprenyl-1,4-benzoquinol methylase
VSSAETGNRDGLEPLLSEQIAYYQARAPEYEAGALEVPGGSELEAALDAFRPQGHVLELACGPGTWTEQLGRHAETVTALDAAREMLAIASARLGHDHRVRFVEADVFNWQPDRRYDVVFFGFWLSHVPLERFAGFWSLVADCLVPGGRLFFADDAYITDDERIEGEAPATIRRRLEDGTPFRAVKVAHAQSGLQQRITDLGWEMKVHQTSGPFFWGSGRLG